jgi:ethanolamine utilization protein EutN
MTLCKVLGSVTATAKHPSFEGRRLMVVQPLDERKQPVGTSFIAVDHICSAGPGDLVLVNREGNGNRQVLNDRKLPIRSLIVALVDEVQA